MPLTAAEWFFVTALAIWTVCSVLRFVHMYGCDSLFQKWRRWDIFNLVPVGAFFSPNPPPTEMWILIRDFLSDGSTTSWTEVPRIPPRGWKDMLWAPKKHTYRAKSDGVRGLLAAVPPSRDRIQLPVSLVISEPYVTLLRFVTALPRITRPLATQFAVIETDVLTRGILRSVVSSVHSL
jgi:hypothetical protein